MMSQPSKKSHFLLADISDAFAIQKEKKSNFENREVSPKLMTGLFGFSLFHVFLWFSIEPVFAAFGAEVVSLVLIG
jgi:hypothetical protein